MSQAVGVIGFDGEDRVEVAEKKSKKKCSGFQGMGLDHAILKGIMKRGYKVPTPIQRKTIPVAIEGRDVVAMARTGSGKTACFLLPLFQKLKQHSGSGLRALILSPTRELAIQTLKFVKELGKFTSLRTIVILGGDSLESQFSMIHGNPDIVVATPGRFLHICLEMKLKLNTVEYVVFDEADRLFEMGFSEQLNEIMRKLPNTRQSVLFSATLPKVLVQFAKAGLTDPVLIRLDVESKIPDTLGLHYFYCRPDERDAALLAILKHIVKEESMTIVFAATKHHVEFLHMLLTHVGISNTYLYSDLDATARKINAAKFRTGSVRVLLVTDVAARGIDIPALDNVVNYNFPAKPKLFIHRVGRCARAGRTGEAYSLVTRDELCYLIDLQLFLGRHLHIVTNDNANEEMENVLGKIPDEILEEESGVLRAWKNVETDAESGERTKDNAYKNYAKSRPAASKDSVRRAKDVPLGNLSEHPDFASISLSQREKLRFVSRVKNYKPSITIFELGQGANSEMSLSARLFRKINASRVEMHRKSQQTDENKGEGVSKMESKSKLAQSNDADIEEAFSDVISRRWKKKKDDNYVPYKALDECTEKGLAVSDLKGSQQQTLEMMGDTNDAMRSHAKVMKKWDPAKRKYVARNDKNKKFKTENGLWLPMSYNSDRYAKWQEREKIREEMDSEEEQVVPQPGCMRQDTHWGRHNLKLHRKKTNPMARVDTEQILKARKLKAYRKKKYNEMKARKKNKNKKKSKRT